MKYVYNYYFSKLQNANVIGPSKTNLAATLEWKDEQKTQQRTTLVNYTVKGTPESLDTPKCYKNCEETRNMLTMVIF